MFCPWLWTQPVCPRRTCCSQRRSALTFVKVCGFLLKCPFSSLPPVGNSGQRGAGNRRKRAAGKRTVHDQSRRKPHQTAGKRRKAHQTGPNRTKPPETRTAANRTKPPETAGKRTQLLKVLPDLRLRAQDAGEDIGTADCDEWATFQRHFFSDTWHSVAAAKAKATAKAAKAKAKGKARALATTAAGRRPTSQAQTWQRKSAYRQMRTLDYLLFLLLGEGLSRFPPISDNLSCRRSPALGTPPR